MAGSISPQRLIGIGSGGLNPRATSSGVENPSAATEDADVVDVFAETRKRKDYF